MICEYFGECGSCTLWDKSIEEQKKLKIENSNELFSFLDVKDFSFYPSASSNYRTRAEFIIWHEGDDISYAMNSKKKETLKITHCPKVTKSIYDLMPKLLRFIQVDEALCNRLFGIEFLSTKKEVLITLLYHKKLDELWDLSAKKIEDEFGIKVIGRSRGVKRVLSADFVNEALSIKDKELQYKIFDTGFVQPNTKVNEQMIGFVIDEIKKQKREDLLELYCGHGNFTIALSGYFKKILATEISKTSIRAALENCKLNSINNISFIRLSSEEFVQAYKGIREFKRLKEIDLKSYNFSHILVDPPRSGLDETSLNLACRFDNIIYISCSQESLRRDLELLNSTHNIIKFALFDQFPYTHHIESGVILHKK